MQVYKLTLPSGVTASGNIVVTEGSKTYATGDITLNAPDGYTLDSIIINGNSIGKTFTVSGDVNITAEVVAQVTFNNNDSTKATAITIGGSAKSNQIIVADSATNILTDGLGNDTFKFESGGGIVTDYNIGSIKNGANKILAKTATQKLTSTYLAYDAKTSTVMLAAWTSSKLAVKSRRFTSTNTPTPVVIVHEIEGSFPRRQRFDDTNFSRWLTTTSS